MRRWIVAAAALALGGTTAAWLLAVADPEAGTRRVFVAVRDLPAGAQLSPDSVKPAALRLGPAASLAFPADAAAQLYDLRATHDLVSGQVIQRSDAAKPASAVERRLVLLPVRSAPPLAAGAHVDLLAVTGPPEHPTVIPFAANVLVSAQSGGALVVAVDPQQAGALAYAALTLPLIAVVTSGRGGGEQPVATLEQAQDLVGR